MQLFCLRIFSLLPQFLIRPIYYNYLSWFYGGGQIFTRRIIFSGVSFCYNTFNLEGVVPIRAYGWLCMMKKFSFFLNPQNKYGHYNMASMAIINLYCAFPHLRNQIQIKHEFTFLRVLANLFSCARQQILKWDYLKFIHLYSCCVLHLILQQGTLF